MSDPDDYYEFILNEVKGANGITPVSKVTKAVVYRGGDTDEANHIILESTYDEDEPDPALRGEPIVAGYNHRLDSRKNSTALPAAAASTLHIELHVPDTDEGKELEFEFRGAGLYSGGSTANLLTSEAFKTAKIVNGTGTVTETRIPGNPPTYYYTVKTKAFKHADMTGVKLVISGTEPFANTDRFTCTLNLPEKYVGEE
jgi:hypothetical protein